MRSAFIDKLIKRMDRLEPGEVQHFLAELLREKGLLEKVFQALGIGMGKAVVDEVDGRLHRAGVLMHGGGAKIADEPSQDFDPAFFLSFQPRQLFASLRERHRRGYAAAGDRRAERVDLVILVVLRRGLETIPRLLLFADAPRLQRSRLGNAAG